MKITFRFKYTLVFAVIISCILTIQASYHTVLDGKISQSFLELQDKAQLNSAITSQSKLLARGRALIARKKRYTNDGRLCAPAFVQDGKAFEDCTTIRSPDGQIKNQEWCYVDAKEKGESNWDYCKPTMDYDKLREINQEDLGQLATECRRVENEISQCIPNGEEALTSLKKVMEGQNKLDNEISQLLKEVSSVKENLLNLFSLKAQWEQVESKCVMIASKIEKKSEENQDREKSEKSVKMEVNEEILRKEQDRDHIKVNPLIQEKVMSQKKSCEGMQSYEEDNVGDGLIGRYFDNEQFLGEYKEMRNANIDFDWTGSSPLPTINTSNFSVRWEGFLLVPFTSHYHISIECDDGATVTLNNELIISHNMFAGNEESKARVNTWLNHEVLKRAHPGKNYNKATSERKMLTGGNKYKIIVSYFHTIHNDIRENEKVYVKLSWKSDQFKEMIIAQRYLYSENTYPPLKISVNDQVAIVRNLLENDIAFKNSDMYIIQDIPDDFKGLTCLKLNMKHLDDKLTFTVNIPIIVYIARLVHYPKFFPTDFENTGEYMSLVQIEKPNPNMIHPGKKITSKKSAMMKIYKKKFKEGEITIPFNMQGINAKGIPFVLFFGFDSQISSPISCGGEELMISKPHTASYKDCQCSSQFNANYGCRNGLMGKRVDKEGSVWATRGQGIGSWINVQFTGLYQITRLIVKNRRYAGERNAEIKVEFSGGETQILTIANTDEKQEFQVDPPVRADSVKFTITKVTGTVNNGGNFEVYGVKCLDADLLSMAPEANSLERATGINPKALPAMFKLKDKQPIVLTCKDSLSNSKNLSTVIQKLGNTVQVKCMDNCANSRSPIYGDHKYSKDSAICKAAYHSAKLKAEGGLVEIVFEAGLSSYLSVPRNGIKSRAKGKSDITISFNAADEHESIVLQNGSKIDYYDVKRGWIPGVITQVKEATEGKVLFIIIEGAEGSETPIEVSYPNKNKVKPCGEKTKNRDCKGSRTDGNIDKPMKIKFAPKNYDKPGEDLLDRGEIFGQSGNPFGWSIDMSNRMRRRNSNDSSPILETLVEFNPDSKSKWCKTRSPQTNCAPSSWSVKAGLGAFYVKLYVGDPQGNTLVNFKINDLPFISSQFVRKGELKIFEGKFDTVNEMLIISSACDHNCQYAMSKLNMIEFYPYREEEEKPKETEEETPEREDPCKNGTIGGRCDKGPDVVHCIFDAPSAPSAVFCLGHLMIVPVPEDYRCPTQRGKFKCVQKMYPNQGKCVKYCPGVCQKGQCLG